MSHIEVSTSFYAVEADLYRNGREAFLMYTARLLSHQLDENGGFKPYLFWCEGGDGALQPHKMIARERWA